MSTSTNAVLAFGIDFDEGYEFPWNSPYDPESEETPEHMDPEDWWYDVVLNYKSNSPNPWDEKGEYLPGMGPKDYRVWADERDAWRKTQPEPPFELENYCSADCPMPFLAMRGTVKTCYRGSVMPLSLDLISTQHDQVEEFKRFVKKYFHDDPECLERLRWHIFAYWG